MTNESMCKIPVQATMQKINGEYVMTSAEFADVPARAIAEYLLKSFGASAIFGDDEAAEAAEEVRRHEQNDVFAVSE